MANKEGTKLCKHCKTEIPAAAKVCPNCRKKQGGIVKWIIIGFMAIAVIGSASSGGDSKNNQKSDNTAQETSNFQTQNNAEKEDISTKENEKEIENKSNKVEETKDKYFVGDTWQNKYIKVTYTDCYEFTDYNQYNAPADGNKIICAEFEFENIGNSDSTVMYTDFHGYADGYEVNQSYAPDGTGLDFTVKMSAGRKGTGKVAFEVPTDSKEIEIEFSPNMWTSENIVFVFE